MKDAGLIELLSSALLSPYGVVVETSDPTACKAKLYPLRNAHPEFACLSFLTSPTDPASSFWIVKKETSNGEAAPDEAHPEPSRG